MFVVVALTIVLQAFLVEGVLKCTGDGHVYNGTCYFFSHDAEEWSQALYLCKTFYGGFLAEVHDQATNFFLATEAANLKYDYWLGANDLRHEGAWQWVTSKSDVMYSHWQPGEPNNFNTGENCASLTHTGFWNDIKCTTPIRFICEVPPSA